MVLRRQSWRSVALASVGALALPVVMSVAASPASAAPTELFFSEYVEGSSNNKALEIYNGTGAAVDLAAGSYNVQIFFNGSSSAGLTINLTGTVATGDVFVLAQSSAAAAILAEADQTNGAGWFNGDDAVVLRKGASVIDSIGQVGFDPGTQWGSGDTSTADNTLRRKATIEAGDANASDAFDPAVEWDGFATDTFDGLGTYGSAPPPPPPPPPADTCDSPYTPIPAIQGSGPSAAITGSVATEGVVVGDYEGPSPTLRGFYIQDPSGDGDPATSDAIFVFHGNTDSVALGDVVHVNGTAAEFQDQTQISATAVLVCGTGTVAPTAVTLPFPSADHPERYEGMLVSLPQTLSVTEHFQLGRFGQVVVSSGGRLTQPTNVVPPGAGALAMQAANDLNRLIIDDALNSQNPDPILFGRGGQPLSASNTLRGGDTVTGLVGVMTYTWAGNSASGNAYRVRPINALGGGIPDFVAANPRPAAPDAVGGSVQVAGMNLLNFFDTFTGCTAGVGGATTDCRGAESQVEFDRQWPKTVAAILGTGAEVVGVIEVENDGYGPDSALQFLVDRLNDVAGPGAYSLIDADARTGQLNALGTDAIKVGLIYRTGAVVPVGATAVLNSEAFVTGGDGEARNRPALAQAFYDPATGGTFVVAVNHLKSKGSACDAPDAGDGQGNCAAVRTAAAQLLADWLAADPTGTGETDALVMGDLNSYARETPIATLEAAGYTNLIRAYHGDDAYSYVFDGQWGYLDHALASSSMVSQVTGVTEWHINADEPSVLDYNTNFKSPGQIASLYAPDQYRMSDHDPVIVGVQAAPGKVTGGGFYTDATSGTRVTVNISSQRLPNGRWNGKVSVDGRQAGISFDTTELTAQYQSGDSVTVVGTGRFNGTAGHTITAAVVDHGSTDTVHLVIRDAGGTVVYDSGVTTLAGGNLTVH